MVDIWRLWQKEESTCLRFAFRRMNLNEFKRWSEYKTFRRMNLNEFKRWSEYKTFRRMNLNEFKRWSECKACSFYKKLRSQNTETQNLYIFNSNQQLSAFHISSNLRVTGPLGEKFEIFLCNLTIKGVLIMIPQYQVPLAQRFQNDIWRIKILHLVENENNLKI